MDEQRIAMMATTILAGYISDERSSADERTLKRAVDFAYRLNEVVVERLKSKAPLLPDSIQKPSA